MSGKKFTDANKWKKQWFRSLSIEEKMAWIYLCDNCDHAGIWIVDVETFNLWTGLNFTLQRILEIFKNHVTLFDNGERIWLRTYFEFQYGDSKDSFSAKISALKLLKKYGLVVETHTTVSPPLLGSPPTLPPESYHTDTTVPPDSRESTSKGISIIKSISFEGGSGGKQKPPDEPPRAEDFTRAWKVYTESLAAHGIPARKKMPNDDNALYRAMAEIGAENVIDALEGARHETASGTFDPKKHLSLDYCLKKNQKTQKSNWERLSNMARANRMAMQNTLTEEQQSQIAQGGFDA